MFLHIAHCTYAYSTFSFALCSLPSSHVFYICICNRYVWGTVCRICNVECAICEFILGLDGYLTVRFALFVCAISIQIYYLYFIIFYLYLVLSVVALGQFRLTQCTYLLPTLIFGNVIFIVVDEFQLFSEFKMVVCACKNLID